MLYTTIVMPSQSQADNCVQHSRVQPSCGDVLRPVDIAWCVQPGCAGAQPHHVTRMLAGRARGKSYRSGISANFRMCFADAMVSSKHKKSGSSDFGLERVLQCSQPAIIADRPRLVAGL